MPELPPNWEPSSDDVTYWRFLKLTGRTIVAWYCLDRGTLAMWARPRDPLLRQAFWNQHAGHEHLFVGEILDRKL
jgi:hypothetical protein